MALNDPGPGADHQAVETTPGGEYLPPPYPQPQWAAPPPPQPTGWGPPRQPNAFVPQPARYTYAPPSHRGRDALVASLVLILIAVAAVVEVTSGSRHAGRDPSTANPVSTLNRAVAPVASASATASPSAAASPSAVPPSSPAPPLSAGGVTATSALTPTGGVKLFSDDFTDAGSGWDVESLDLGSFAYGHGGYVISTHALVHMVALSPYYLSVQQIVLSMTAHESAGAPQTGGFGLLCNRGGNSVVQLRYEFVVNESGRWFIERNQGQLSTAPGHSAMILKEGTLTRPLGTRPLTLSAVCAGLPDGRTTRLAIFLDGTQVGDITDVATLDGQGWLGGLVSAGGAGVPATSTVSSFSENSLGTDIPTGGVPEPHSSSPQLRVNT